MFQSIAQYDPNLPKIEAYGSDLNQVWTNLIDNAIGAMNGQGEMTLRTRHDDQWVYVQIADNGPGIPDEIQPYLFDPFFTTKAPGTRDRAWVEYQSQYCCTETPRQD